MSFVKGYVYLNYLFNFYSYNAITFTSWHFGKRYMISSLVLPWKMGYNVGEISSWERMGKLHKEKFNQLPVRSRLIFLADHLANHHNEDTYNFLLMILKSLSLRISVLPQFWGVVMRGGNPSPHLRKDLLGLSCWDDVVGVYV